MSVSLGSLDALHKEMQGNKVDLLVCNILAPVIKELAIDFSKVTSATSELFLSGLLTDQIEDIIGFMSILDWKLMACFKQENWALVHLCRNRP